MSSPTVSAIVLNYRTPQEAVRCVEALLRQTINGPHPPSPSPVRGRGGEVREGLGVGALEVFVVDNHSCDDSIGVLRNRLGRFPSVHILESPHNVGYARGNTLALRRVQGKYILIINPDNTLEPTGLTRMVAAMERDPTIGILAPRLLHEDGTVRDSYRTFPSVTDLLMKRTVLRHMFPGRMRRYLQWDADPHAVRDVDWVVGACLLIRRTLLATIGSFDPRFFLFFEDIDLCRRSWEIGQRVVYFPQVTATDRKHRLSEGGLSSLLFHAVGRAHMVSALRYFWKWCHYPLPRRS